MQNTDNHRIIVGRVDLTVFLLTRSRYFTPMKINDQHVIDNAESLYFFTLHLQLSIVLIVTVNRRGMNLRTCLEKNEHSHPMHLSYMLEISDFI